LREVRFTRLAVTFFINLLMAKSRKFGGTLFLLVLIAAVAVGGYYFWKRSDEKPPEVSTATVSRGDVLQVVTATGVLQAPTSVDVSSQISGQITEVLVDYNQKVNKGDVLARIDPATYLSRKRQADANFASTKANNTLTRLNTDRIRELRTKNLVSQQELDQAEAQLAQSDAQLKTSQASVEDAQVNLDRCTIFAPIDGIVLDRLAEVGKMVAASLNAPTLFTLVTDLTKMEISADVAEADIGSIAVDQEVKFLVDAFPGREFRGRVAQIRNLPKTAQSVVVYATIIEVTNDDLRLKPGMTANVTIVTSRRSNVLKIANAALRARIPEKFQPKADSPVAAAASGKNDGVPAASSNGSSGSTSGAGGGERRQGGAGGAGGGNREQLRALMQEAGITFTPGQPPAPDAVERLRKLAAERGIEVPERFLSGGGRNRNSGESAVMQRTVYRLLAPAPELKLEAVSARFGISDGTTTEVVDGLREGDTLVTSIYIPGEAAGPAQPAARSPFGGQTGGFGPGGGGGGGRR
jgi:HlyD family secretion protein